LILVKILLPAGDKFFLVPGAGFQFTSVYNTPASLSGGRSKKERRKIIWTKDNSNKKDS